MDIGFNCLWSRWIIGIGWSKPWKFFQISFGPLLITISWHKPIGHIQADDADLCGRMVRGDPPEVKK